MNSTCDWIKLNVGGTLYETTRTTLLSRPNSLLAKMFDPGSTRPPAALGEDGAYRVDADPRAFAAILTWLRRGRVIVPTDSCLEADYFGLVDMVEETTRMVREKEKDMREKEISPIPGDISGEYENIRLSRMVVSNF